MVGIGLGHADLCLIGSSSRLWHHPANETPLPHKAGNDATYPCRTDKRSQATVFINISHEIRTPMSLIISPLQKLMTNDTDHERQKNYRIIWRNSERILRLVNQLMDIRKIDKGQMSLVFRETEMTGFINDLCETFTEQANKNKLLCSSTTRAPTT